MATPIVPSKRGESSANGVTEVTELTRSEMIDLVNDVDRHLAQLNSLLACSYGFGQEWMEEMGKDHRDNLMWLASDLGRSVEDRFSQLRSSFFALGGKHV
jgi:hypothetical protein